MAQIIKIDEIRDIRFQFRCAFVTIGAIGG